MPEGSVSVRRVQSKISLRRKEDRENNHKLAEDNQRITSQQRREVILAGGTGGNSSMSSYFANSYIPDLRNGGVEHPHQHQQHYGAAVQVPQQTQSTVQQQSQQTSDPCDPSLLRQGVSTHHYGTTGGQQDMPYPRFPPYNRIDMRNAAYYQHQQEHGSMDGMAGYRSTSPSTGMGHMGHTSTPNGHPSTPIVYASCKLQAAAVDHQGSVLDGPDSPPLVESQMHHQMHSQHPHMQAQQSQHPQQQSQHQHLQAQQQHMMYQQQQQSQTTSQQGQSGMHPQQQQQAQQHQGVVASPLSQQQQGAPQGAATANIPSPLYPWMRSQFGECNVLLLISTMLAESYSFFSY